MARSENDQTPVVNSIVPARATSSNAVARSTSSSVSARATSSNVLAPATFSDASASSTAVAVEQPDTQEISESFNSKDTVGGVPFANYSELFRANMEELFEDLRTGPASFITLQNVTRRQYDELMRINAEHGGFFLEARSPSENLFLAKKTDVVRLRSVIQIQF
jgi:hypothetical protein